MSRRTIRKRVSRQENTRAQKIFFIAVGVLLWMMLISVIGIISLSTRNAYVNPFYSSIFITIFVFLIIGISAIVKKKPPFHHFIIIAAALNLIISNPFIQLIPEAYLLHFPLSLIILYLGMRFPVSMAQTSVTLKRKTR